jgi:hypothetical protein
MDQAKNGNENHSFHEQIACGVVTPTQRSGRGHAQCVVSALEHDWRDSSMRHDPLIEARNRAFLSFPGAWFGI